MTQPIQEPGTQRSISTGTWNTNQIYRRPAPQAGNAVPIEWISMQSTTNWLAAGTDLSFSFVAGNYDSTTPTFDVVSGSPTIYRSGAYEFRISCVNATLTIGVQSVVRLDMSRTAGAIPYIFNYIPDQQLVYSVGPANTDSLSPWWQGMILYSGSAGSLFGTPTTLQVEATKLDDGVAVNDSAPTVGLLIVRLGDAFS